MEELEGREETCDRMAGALGHQGSLHRGQSGRQVLKDEQEVCASP